MSTLQAKIEALLAVSPRPLHIKKLAELTGAKKEEVREAVTALSARLEDSGSGSAVVQVGDEVRFGSAPELSGIVEAFVKDETTGELTRPQLETLTVIAYRGPVSKAELDQIRGVNCTIIIRNLLLRGLIDEDIESGVPTYQVSMEFMRFLGVRKISDLPDYELLRKDKRLEDILEAAAKDI